MSLLQRAAVRILNPHDTLSALHLTLTHANLLDESRLRPTWDSYFMHLADLAARRSNCMKRRVGCVLVRAGRVISTGYNGTPRGVRNCNEGGCGRCNGGEGSGQGLSSCLCLHAEVPRPFTHCYVCSWIFSSCLCRVMSVRADIRKMHYWKQEGKESAWKQHYIVTRIHPSRNWINSRCPCLTCSVKLVQVGVKEVVYSVSYSMDTQAEDVMRAGGVKVRQFSPPQEGLIW